MLFAVRDLHIRHATRRFDMRRKYWWGILGVAAGGAFVFFRNRDRLIASYQGWTVRRRMNKVAPQIAERSHERFERGASIAEHFTTKH